MKILIIQQKMIGDVLTSTILFEALRKKFPAANLHYLVNQNTVGVLENNPFIDKIIIKKASDQDKKTNFLKLGNRIQSENYDVVIDVYGKIGSTLITRLSGARTRIGYQKDYTAFLFTHPVKRHKIPRHEASLAIENRLKLLEPLGIDFEFIAPKIHLTTDECSAAKQILKNNGVDLKHPLLMFSLLGSKPNKNYPGAYMAELIDFCSRKYPNAQFLFNYIPHQKEEAKEIYKRLHPKTQERAFFKIYGQNLREFLAMTTHCQATIGNEGGANNMAKALEVPTFSIFSPYLRKRNWFGECEKDKHRAVHLSDFINYDKKDKELAKANPNEYYHKFKPDFIKPELEHFIGSL